MSGRSIAEALAGTAQRFAGAGIDDAHLEAEVLLAHSLGIDRTRLLARLRDSLQDVDAEAYERLVARRLRHEPLAYITGRREFFGLEILCGPDALIPRPESELLVEIALEVMGARGAALRILDVGTGTGAIAVAIAVHAPACHVTAVDASTGALGLARRNAALHGVDSRVAFEVGDLMEGLGEFDVIVANLPYVSAGEWGSLAPEIRLWEPRTALVGGERGTEVIERLVEEAPSHLAVGGILAAEIGDTQAAAISACARQRFPEAAIHVRTDLAGLDRALVVRT